MSGQWAHIGADRIVKATYAALADARTAERHREAAGLEPWPTLDQIEAGAGVGDRWLGDGRTEPGRECRSCGRPLRGRARTCARCRQRDRRDRVSRDVVEVVAVVVDAAELLGDLVHGKRCPWCDSPAMISYDAHPGDCPAKLLYRRALDARLAARRLRPSARVV